MGKRNHSTSSGASNKKPKLKKRSGETFYKNEKDFEHFAVEEDPNEFIRDVTEKPTKPAKPTKIKKEQKTKVSKQESSDEEVQESAYSKLLSSLSTKPASKHKKILEKIRKEQQGDEDSDKEANNDTKHGEQSSKKNKEEIEKEIAEEESFLKKHSKTERKSGNKEELAESGVEEGEESDDENVNIDILATAGVEEDIEGDKFTKHFNEDISDLQVRDLEGKKVNYNEIEDEILGPVLGTKSIPKTKKSLVDYKMKRRLADQFDYSTQTLSSFQHKLFSMMNDYSDVFYPKETTKNIQEIRIAYVLHALNHTIKARDKILKGNAKLNGMKESNSENNIEIKDQGFTRPRVLIIAPFRNSAYEIIKLIIDYAPKIQQERVANKARFFTEFKEEEEEEPNPHKPDDFNELFKGNIDDCFRIGISFTKKQLKLYSDFYSSDIIIASPLGMRLAIGSPGEKGYDCDFLSSIEITIVDQSDVYLMQNWEHISYIFESINQISKKPHGTDFSRLRNWYLNGWAKYYRQTIIFSSFSTPELNSLWNKFAQNRRGKFKAKDTYPDGSVTHVVPKVRQVFQRLNCDSLEQIDEFRFQYFVNEVLNRIKNSVQSHTLIFIPSYFDYVRIRNYFKKEELSFDKCDEYMKVPEVSRARSYFFTGRIAFLLVTERFYFFKRYKIRGIHNIIFYQLPTYAHYYSELLNLVEESDATCTVLFSKFDKFQLERVVGSSRSTQMINGERNMYLIV